MSIKKKFCCEDMRITVEDYKHIDVKVLCRKKYYRCQGHALNYCPFCGETLDSQSVDFKEIIRRQIKDFVLRGVVPK